MSEDWIEFDRITSEIGVACPTNHPSNVNLFIDNVGQEVEGDFGPNVAAKTLTSSGSCGADDPVVDTHETITDLMYSMAEHDCKHGTLVRYDNAKKLVCGWVCSQCGQSWGIIRKNFLHSDIPKLFLDLNSPEGRTKSLTAIQSGKKIKYAEKMKSDPLKLKIRYSNNEKG